MRRASTIGPALVIVCGCSAAPPAPPYRPVADVNTVMISIMEPAAEIYWDAVSTVIDKRGERQIEPKTAAEWEAVRNAAFVVAESGNLLMMPARAKDGGEWMTASQRMIEAAQQAIRAAESRDNDAVFAAGGDLYDACTTCHVKYAPDIARGS